MTQGLQSIWKPLSTAALGSATQINAEMSEYAGPGSPRAAKMEEMVHHHVQQVEEQKTIFAW